MLFANKTKKVDTDPIKINNLLTRGVEDVFVVEDLRRKLDSGKELRVKLGFDPTGSRIHIGRAIVLRKLREFQNLGHKIVFIVGDFTALIGDPSDKLSKRPMLSPETIKINLRDYKNQVGKIIDLSATEFQFNSRWLANLKFDAIALLAESFSVQQMIGRRNFKERMDRGEEISLREFLYPLLQGYDSVQVSADVEIGGFDQLFNLKAGRIIQRHYGQPEQDVLTTKMLLGTDGRKMSTSWGNVINITDSPDEMFGKIMSLHDDLIADYLLLCTDTPEDEIREFKAAMQKGNNPRDFKAILGKRIVSIYHGAATAEKAAADFDMIFKKGAVPENIDAVTLTAPEALSDILIRTKLVSSKTEFRRLADEGAITLLTTGEKIMDPAYMVKDTADFKVGKHRFVRVVYRN